MISRIASPALAVSLVALTACGAGTDGGVTDERFVGSTGAVASNGLEYAQKFSTKDDTIGVPISVRVLRSVPNETGTGASLVWSDAVITISDSPQADGWKTRDMVMEIDGETINIVERFSTEGALGADEWRVWSYLQGGGVSAEAIYSYDAGTGDDFSEGTYLFGFETDPATLGNSGSYARYTGDFAGSGQVYLANGATPSEYVYASGEFEIDVNFASGEVDGTLDGSVGSVAGYSYASNEFAAGFESEIVGNGFVADLEVTCTAECEDNGSFLGAAFYGRGASEVAGIAGLDFTLEGLSETAGDPTNTTTGTFVGAVGLVSDQKIAGFEPF